MMTNIKFFIPVLFLTVQAQANDCSIEKMNELRAAASALDSKTAPLSEALAKCPEYHDEALLWAAMYYNQNGLYRESAIVANEVNQSDKITDRYVILAQAGQGKHQKLEELIRNKKNGYYGDAEAHLVLARALMRARQPEKSFEQYEAYLKLKPDDSDVRIESAYAHLWNDDWQTSQKKFNYLSLQTLNESQKKLVESGMAQTEKVRQRQIKEGVAYGASVPLGYERNWNSYKSFARQSLQSGYHTSAFHFDAAIMDLSSNDYNTQQTAGEVLISKNFVFKNNIDVFVKAGWLQGVGGNYTAAAVVSKTFESGFRPLVGFESTPLVKIAPVPKQHTDWSQQAIFAGFRYKDRFEYRLYALTATEQGNAAKHSLLLEMPIRSSEEYGEFKFKVLAENLQAQRYSQYVYSPKDSTIILPGVLWNVKVDEISDLESHIDYGFVSETLNPGAQGNSTQSLSNNSSGQVFGFGLNYKTKIDTNFDTNIKFDYIRTSAGGSVSYQSGTIYFGIIWYPDLAEKGMVP